MDEIKKMYDSFSEEEKTQVWMNLSRICAENVLMKTLLITGGLVTGGLVVFNHIKKKRKQKREESN